MHTSKLHMYRFSDNLNTVYSRIIWRGIKFGSLADRPLYCQIKYLQNLFRAYIHMTMLYRSTKLKSANISELYVWDQTTKFNFCQIFHLYTVAFFASFPHTVSLSYQSLTRRLLCTYSQFHILTAKYGAFTCLRACTYMYV